MSGVGRGFVEIDLHTAKAECDAERQPRESTTGNRDASAHGR